MADKVKTLKVGPAEREWLANMLKLDGAGGAEALVQLLPSLGLRSYSGGAEIIREGDAGTDLFFLYKGVVAVKKARALIGKKEIVKLKPGDFFGEVGFLVQAPRSATLVAQGEAQVLRVDPGEFARLLKERPEVASRMEETARQRMQKLAES